MVRQPKLLGFFSGPSCRPGMGGGISFCLMIVLLWANPAAAQEAPPLPGEAAHAHAAPPAEAAPDSSARPQRVPVTYTSHQWRRPLWEPYAPTLLDELAWRSNWLVHRDGGLGSATMILGEMSTTALPRVEWDGVPVGTGHILADDPLLTPNEFVLVNGGRVGFDPYSGADGLLSLETEDPNPRAAVSRYRGTKGKHESYQRGFSLLTPRAAWRAGFSFAESLDQEAYNFSDEAEEIFRRDEEFPGHCRLRNSRAWLVRNLTPATSLTVQYRTGRKTKDSLPALATEHQEIWDAGTSATMKSRNGAWQWRTVLFRNSRDVRWGDRPGSSGPAANARLLETTRSGVHLRLGRDAVGVRRSAAADSSAGSETTETGPRLDLRLDRWIVRDTGPDWSDEGISDGGGTEGRLTLGTAGPLWGSVRYEVALNGTSHSLDEGPDRAGLGGVISFRDPGLGLNLSLTRGGRLPRSDELLTPLRREIDGRRLQLLPNSELDLEQLTRLELVASRRLLGLDLALAGSVRQLRNGISWRRLESDGYQGRWHNDLDLDATRVTGSVERQGRFLGWARIRLEKSWQDIREKSGTAPILQPDQTLRLQVHWENHLFMEDGILQIALYSTQRSEMPDPWDLTRATVLPGATWHDLLVGFRLVGTDLGLAFRNMTDQRIRLSSGSWSHGREMEMRLRWTFLY